MTLLQRFLDDECDSCIRGLLEAALGESQPSIRSFSFNGFDITIDREAETVLVVDVLEANVTQRVSIAELAEALTVVRAT